ncbi:MAG: hypothetical protein R6U98_05600, partial [Pirellulaceae bacterium]
RETVSSYFRRLDFSGWKAARRKPSSRWSDSRRRKSSATCIFQAVGFFRMGRCPTQAVLPLVGLAAEKVIRDRYILGG